MKLIFIAILLLCSLASIGQFPYTLNQVSPDKALEDKNYRLVANPNTLQKLPFEKIIVLDRRYDTTKIGYKIKSDFFRSSKKAFTKTKLGDDVAPAIQKFYNEQYAGNFTKNHKELLIVLKTFWMSAMPGSAMKHTKESTEQSLLDVHLKFEYYFKTDSDYIPFKRLDTVFQILIFDTTSTPLEVESSDMIFLTYCLKTMAEIPDYSYYESSLSKRTKKTFAEIEDFNQQRFDLPVLKEPVKKGIYRTFAEFKNNAPSITDFEKTPIKETFVFLSNNLPIRNFWAYFDGKELGYGTNGKYLMFRVGNTFEVFTPEIVINPATPKVGLFVPPGVSSRIIIFPKMGSGEKKVWCPKQINMETGEAY